MQTVTQPLPPSLTPVAEFQVNAGRNWSQRFACLPASERLPAADRLVDRVRDMERLWSWVMLPGEPTTKKPRDN